MTGPSYWPPSPQGAQVPQLPPFGVQPAGGAPPVSWAGGVAVQEQPRPAGPPADVGGVLRLVAGALLLAAGVLAAVAAFLPLYSLEFEGEELFAVDGWSFLEGGGEDITPARWGIPILMAAAALVAGALLVVLSRWARGLRVTGAAVGLLGVGGVLAVGWLLGSLAGDLVDSWHESPADYDPHTGGGTVLLTIATWTALAALVPLLLAPVLDAARARATAGGVW